MIPETCNSSATEAQAVNVALLPCPFCQSASAPKLKRWDMEPAIPGFYVVCDAAGWEGKEGRGCGCSGAYGETEADAIAAWNRRAAPTLPADVKGAIDRFATQIEIAQKWADAEKPSDAKGLPSTFELQVGLLKEIGADLAAALTAQAALLDRAREVIKPFAEEANEWADSVPDTYHPGVTEPKHSQAHASAKFNLGHLRAASRLHHEMGGHRGE